MGHISNIFRPVRRTLPEPKGNHLVRTRESSRVVELSDNLGNLMYVVSFNEDFLVTNPSHDVVQCWVVKVVTINRTDDPVIIYEKRHGQYDDAMVDFNRNLMSYKSLVKAQARHLGDMEIYGEKVGYRKMDVPKCCWTCAFSVGGMCRGHLHPSIGSKIDQKMECHNPELFKTFYRDGFVDPSRSIMGEIRTDIDIHPKVDPDGVCSQWKMRQPKDMPPVLYPFWPKGYRHFPHGDDDRRPEPEPSVKPSAPLNLEKLEGLFVAVETLAKDLGYPAADLHLADVDSLFVTLEKIGRDLGYKITDMSLDNIDGLYDTVVLIGKNLGYDINGLSSTT